MVKQTSLTSAKSVVGMCPDMCPEKERYRREDTRRLSWFEVDHATYVPGVSRKYYVIQLQHECYYHPLLSFAECKSRSQQSY
jgi:hypothetical protein